MEVYRALGLLIEAPAEGHRTVAAALGLPSVPDGAIHGTEVAFQRYPYASVYLGEEGKLGGDARNRIAGFWTALGMELPGEPDHISSLLSLMTSLGEAESTGSDAAEAALLAQARATLAWEHLHAWCVPYLHSFRSSPSPYYRMWAEMTRGAVEQGLDPSPPDHLPGALVAAAAYPLTDPREGEAGGGFVPKLLAPIRSGVVILRSDLADLADSVGLAMRAGERAYALSWFLGQDPGGTLAWLAGFAQRWAADLEGGTAAPDTVVRWWADRARSTAALLTELAEDVDAQVLVAEP